MKFSRLIWANLTRKKVRLILTIGSFAVALFLFTFLGVVKSAFSRGTELAGADRLVTINRIGLINVLPLSYDDKIRAIPGVEATGTAAGIFRQQHTKNRSKPVGFDRAGIRTGSLAHEHVRAGEYRRQAP